MRGQTTTRTCGLHSQYNERSGCKHFYDHSHIHFGVWFGMHFKHSCSLLAVPVTIVIDFLYQITFFVALIVIDERRIKNNRRDCCVCITANNDNISEQEPNNGDVNNGDVNDDDSDQQQEQTETLSYRAMTWYAKQLLRPWVQALVILGLCGLSSLFCQQW